MLGQVYSGLFDQSCLLVTLNSNMEVFLWCADKNFLNGEWTKATVFGLPEFSWIDSDVIRFKMYPRSLRSFPYLMARTMISHLIIWRILRSCKLKFNVCQPLQVTIFYNLIGMIGMDWSSQPDFNVWPKPQVDASLLALGNRRGSVIFMGYIVATV